MGDFAIKGSGQQNQTIQGQSGGAPNGGPQVGNPINPTPTPESPATGSTGQSPSVQGHPNGAPSDNTDQMQRGQGREGGARDSHGRSGGTRNPLDGAFVRHGGGTI